ncbi:hypothetical protein P0933_18950, partial [Bacillus velezensis]|uniref:hypothetical protein n=1 Tax=Bacillus velezensis TaxID=492670 RepID=UPI0023D7E894
MFGRKNEDGRLDFSANRCSSEKDGIIRVLASPAWAFHAFSHHDALKNYHILLLLILFGYQVVILNEKDAG